MEHSLRLWILVLSLLAAGGGRLHAARPWTVEAILNIPSLSDPQIRPDGRSYAWVQRAPEGKAWRNTVRMATIPSGAVKVVGAGTQPRWSPDSTRLAYLDKQVHLLDRVVTHSASPITSYRWTPDGRAIAYLAVDAGPEPDPIIADRDYRYSR